jgi:hypothetical protein
MTTFYLHCSCQVPTYTTSGGAADPACPMHGVMAREIAALRRERDRLAGMVAEHEKQARGLAEKMEAALAAQRRAEEEREALAEMNAANQRRWNDAESALSAARAALWACRAGDGCLCSGGPFTEAGPQPHGHSARCREWMAALTPEQRAALGPSGVRCAKCGGPTILSPTKTPWCVDSACSGDREQMRRKETT